MTKGFTFRPDLPVMPSISCFIKSICFWTLGSIFLLNNWQNNGFSETSLNASRVVFANSVYSSQQPLQLENFKLEVVKYRTRSVGRSGDRTENRYLFHRRLHWTQVRVIYDSLQEIAFYILEYAMNRLGTADAAILDFILTVINYI